MAAVQRILSVRRRRLPGTRRGDEVPLFTLATVPSPAVSCVCVSVRVQRAHTSVTAIAAAIVTADEVLMSLMMSLLMRRPSKRGVIHHDDVTVGVP